MRNRYTEEQILRILKEAEDGKVARDVYRKYHVSETTIYRWKATYGGMQVSDRKKVKELEQENERLIKLLAELTLYNRMLKDANLRKR